MRVLGFYVVSFENISYLIYISTLTIMKINAKRNSLLYQYPRSSMLEINPQKLPARCVYSRHCDCMAHFSSITPFLGVLNLQTVYSLFYEYFFSIKIFRHTVIHLNGFFFWFDFNINLVNERSRWKYGSLKVSLSRCTKALGVFKESKKVAMNSVVHFEINLSFFLLIKKLGCCTSGSCYFRQLSDMRLLLIFFTKIFKRHA